MKKMLVVLMGLFVLAGSGMAQLPFSDDFEGTLDSWSLNYNPDNTIAIVGDPVGGTNQVVQLQGTSPLEGMHTDQNEIQYDFNGVGTLYLRTGVYMEQLGYSDNPSSWGAGAAARVFIGGGTAPNNWHVSLCIDDIGRPRFINSVDAFNYDYYLTDDASFVLDTNTWYEYEMFYTGDNVIANIYDADGMLLLSFDNDAMGYPAPAGDPAEFVRLAHSFPVTESFCYYDDVMVDDEMPELPFADNFEGTLDSWTLNYNPDNTIEIVSDPVGGDNHVVQLQGTSPVQGMHTEQNEIQYDFNGVDMLRLSARVYMEQLGYSDNPSSWGAGASARLFIGGGTNPNNWHISLCIDDEGRPRFINSVDAFNYDYYLTDDVNFTLDTHTWYEWELIYTGDNATAKIYDAFGNLLLSFDNDAMGYPAPAGDPAEFIRLTHSFPETESFCYYDDALATTQIDGEGPVLVHLLPTSDVVLPASGGLLTYDVRVASYLPTTYPNVWYWEMVLLPNDNWYPTNGTLFQQQFNLIAGMDVTVGRSLNVPAAAPGGVYSLCGGIGGNPNGDWFKYDCVVFSKGATATDGQGEGFSDWSTSGDMSAFQIASTASERTLPMAYSLSSAYPNPFNPTTALTATLPEAGELNVVVFDVLGRQVARLASGWHAAGAHTLSFDGRGLASGIYFIKAEVPGQMNEIRKVTLLQ